MVPTVGWSSSADELAEADAADEEVEQWILRAVNAEVESLPETHRNAVRLIYLKELPRYQEMTRQAAIALSRAAESLMIPRLRMKGVLVGGR